MRTIGRILAMLLVVGLVGALVAVNLNRRRASAGPRTFAIRAEVRTPIWPGRDGSPEYSLLKLRLVADGVPVAVDKSEVAAVYGKDYPTEQVLHCSLKSKPVRVAIGPDLRQSILETAMPKLVVEVLYPTGWARVARTSVSTEVGSDIEVTMLAEIERVPSALVLIDNRGGKAGVVDVGLHRIEVPPDALLNLDVAMGASMPEAVDVSLPDRRIGTILRRAIFVEGKSDSFNTPQYLVDMSGSRCYRERWVDYGDVGPVYSGPTVHVRSRKYLHLCEGGSFHDLFREAPRSTSLALSSKVGVRHELTDTVCK